MALPNNIKIILEGLNGDHNLNKGEYILDTEHHILYLGIGDFGNFEGIMPTGDIYITANGTYDVLYFENAVVNVPTGGVQPTGTIRITQNGLYDVAQYANADVEVDREYVEYTVPGENNVAWGGQSALGALCDLIDTNKITAESYMLIVKETNTLPNATFPDRDTASSGDVGYYECPVFQTNSNVPTSKRYNYSSVHRIAYGQVTSYATRVLEINFDKSTGASQKVTVYTQELNDSTSSHDLTNDVSCKPGTRFRLYY